jgi:hypothetical protein
MNVPPATDEAIRREIVNELYLALSRLSVADELLAIVGSLGNADDDALTLHQLRAFNRNATHIQ